MQHPRNPGIRLVRQLFVSFPHSARSFRNALIWQPRWFGDVYRQSLREQMLPGDWHLSGEGGGRCTRQLICVRNDRRAEREATSKGVIINDFEGGKSSRPEKLMPRAWPNWNLEMRQQRGTATRIVRQQQPVLTFRVDQSLPRTEIGGWELLLYFRDIFRMQDVEPALTQQVTLCGISWNPQNSWFGKNSKRYKSDIPGPNRRLV